MTRIADPNIVGIPPNLWPPALELPKGKWLSQTGVIVSYLSQKLGLAGYAKDDANLDEDEKAFLSAKNSQLFFTVLDMVVEVNAVCSRGPVHGDSSNRARRYTTFTTRFPSTSTTRTRRQRRCVLQSNSELPVSQNSYNTSSLFLKQTPQTRAAKVTCLFQHNTRSDH